MPHFHLWDNCYEKFITFLQSHFFFCLKCQKHILYMRAFYHSFLCRNVFGLKAFKGLLEKKNKVVLLGQVKKKTHVSRPRPLHFLAPPVLLLLFFMSNVFIRKNQQALHYTPNYIAVS